MKRLIKKSNLNLDTVVNAIYSALHEPNPNSLANITSDLVTKHPECAYHGEMYRGLIINIDKDKYADEEGYITLEGLANAIENNVVNNNSYCSFSEYLDSAEQFLEDNKDFFTITSQSISVIIRQVSEGLNINSLIKTYIEICEKDRPDLKETLKDLLDAYGHENEIFAKQYGNFEIESVSGEYFDDLEPEFLIDEIYI